MKTSHTTKTNELLPPLGICAIFKDEASQGYLKEWIEFHRIQGVSKFFLYNNNSTDNYLEVLQPYIDRGIVDLTEWSHTSPCQLSAYQHFIDKAVGKKVWIAFIDIDEFLFSPKFDNVVEVLATQKEPCAFGVSWMCFGSSEQQEYNPKPVIERFTWRPKEDHFANVHIKSIIRMDQGVSVISDPHYFLVQNSTFNENGEILFGPYNPHTSNLLRINHYATKSRNEWYKRGLKGKPDVPEYKIDWSKFDQLQQMEVNDTDIQKFLPELKKRIESKEIIL